jgi:hypothetical protein
VPSATNQNSVFALHVQVLNQTYAQVVQSFTSSQQSGRQPLVIVPYALPKVPKVVGIKASGTLPNTNVAGTAVILPLRSYTLKIWTTGSTNLNDFNNNILPNLSFSP